MALYNSTITNIKIQNNYKYNFLRWPVRDITIYIYIFFLLKLSRDDFNLSRDKSKLSPDNLRKNTNCNVPYGPP